MEMSLKPIEFTNTAPHHFFTRFVALVCVMMLMLLLFGWFACFLWAAHRAGGG